MIWLLENYLVKTEKCISWNYRRRSSWREDYQEQARHEYLDLTSKSSNPLVTELQTAKVTKGQNIVDILVESDLVSSRVCQAPTVKQCSQSQ